jgi:ribosomal protein S4
MNKAPCKDCPDRKVGCHSTCKKYLAFRQERIELNKKIYKQKEAEYAEFSRYMKALKEKQKQSTKYWH